MLHVFLQRANYSADFYDRMATDFCRGSNDNGPLLVCTDAHFKFIKIGTVDPGDPQGRNIEVTREYYSV